MPTNQYVIPRYGSSNDRLLGWMLEARQEGQAWLDAQPQSTQWAGAMQQVSGIGSGSALDDMSGVNYPKSKRIAREMVASLASFKYEGEYDVLWDNSMYDTAHLLTQIDRHWYDRTFANKQHRSGIQHAIVKGTGYWWHTWDRNYWGPGMGDVRLTAVDPNNVTFVQLPDDNDLQRAYVVLIRVSLPLNLAKRIYAPINPEFADGLTPDRNSPGWIQKGLDKLQKYLSPALRVAGRTGMQSNNGSFPVVDIYHAYTLDGSLNETGHPMAMGPAGTNWSYTVPAYGDGIPTGKKNPANGFEMTRPAKEEDILLFPLRRYTVFSSTGVAMDGPASNWHGDVPLARVWFNDWPWQSIGGSSVSDMESMETGIVALMRVIEDSAAARLDPPVLYDDSLVSSSFAKSLNVRAAGFRGSAPINSGKVLEFPVDPRTYDVPPWITQWIQEQEGRMDYISGVRDLVAMAKAKQIPGADTLEKMFEMAGPIVQDNVKALEEPFTQLGKWRMSMYFQFYSKARIINTVGPDDADQLITRQFISEPMQKLMGSRSFQFDDNMWLPGMAKMGTRQRTETLKTLISQFVYSVTESGLSEINRMSQKLFYLQLMKEGFPISWWTFAKIARIPNFGPPPQGTNTEMERWVAQQQIKIDMQVDVAEQMQQAQNPQGAPGQGVPGGDQVGRPQTYATPPRIVSKDGGTRSTVSTAARS